MIRAGLFWKQIRDDAAGDRRDDLLAHRRVGNDAVIDLIAARLLVIGDDLLERDVFFLAKPWVHHTVAVVAAALAIWGRANDPAAPKAREARSSDRRVRMAIPVSSRLATAAY